LRKQDHGELQEHRVGVSSITPDLDILKQLVAVSKPRQPPAEACNQQRLATSRGLQPAEAYDQQRLTTSSVLRPTETGESWHRHLTVTGPTTFPTAYPMQLPSYQNTPISLLNEDIFSLNKRTASRAESCLLAIMNYNSQIILSAETFF
jgi:hypothetical protein